MIFKQWSSFVFYIIASVSFRELKKQMFSSGLWECGDLNALSIFDSFRQKHINDIYNILYN